MHVDLFSTGLLHILLLIIVANGTPILLRDIMHSRMNTPLDFGMRFVDGRRLLGDSKTWRGVLAAIMVTALLAAWLDYPAQTGAMVAALAMLGDCTASFIKRRLSLPPSSMAPLLDQVPESLLPAWVLMETFGLDTLSVFVVSGLFIVFELSASVVLYRLGIRKRPY